MTKEQHLRVKVDTDVPGPLVTIDERLVQVEAADVVHSLGPVVIHLVVKPT